MSIEQWSDLLFPEAGEKDAHLWGSVKAVNSDGSYEVQLNTSSVTTRCAAGCTAGVGDRVLVCIMANGRCVAVARLEGSAAEFSKNVLFNKSMILANSQALYGLNAEGEWRNLATINSSNNTTFGYGGYAAEEGYTNLYGNGIGLYWKGNLGGDHFKRLWSGTWAVGGSITVEDIAKYRIIGVVFTNQYTMMLGARNTWTGTWIRCLGGYNSGTTHRLFDADISVDGTTLTLRGATMYTLTTSPSISMSEQTIASVWGMF